MRQALAGRLHLRLLSEELRCEEGLKIPEGPEDESLGSDAEADYGCPADSDFNTYNSYTLGSDAEANYRYPADSDFDLNTYNSNALQGQLQEQLAALERQLNTGIHSRPVESGNERQLREHGGASGQGRERVNPPTWTTLATRLDSQAATPVLRGSASRHEY